ncbi:MAG: HEAT repeat domain-containing protein [Planctomycetota bacterium]
MSENGEIQKLTAMLRQSPEDAEKYYQLGVLLGRAGLLSCGRERGTHRTRCHKFCCAEWALRRAWVYAPQDPRPPWALDRILSRPPQNMKLPHPNAVERYASAEKKVNFLHSLGYRGGPVYEQALLGFLTSPDVTLRLGAVLGLGEIGNPSYVQRLTMMVEHDALEVQEAAATALGLIADPQAVDTLIARCVAADEVIPPQREEEEEEPTDEFDVRITGFFENVALGGVRSAAAWALSMIGDDRALETLAEPLPDHSPEYRAEAARALARFERADMIPFIVDFTGDYEASVRLAAVEALAAFRKEKVVTEALEKLAEKDPDEDVRFTAAIMLGREYEPPPEPPESEDSDTRKSGRIELPDFDLEPPPDMPEPPSAPDTD